ncbi:DUF317 domain-containing protein [Streptomyces sp. SDT5-1]|uniref:DUF317 domain-containing protein n=1 Tax=Streptomyces sp. SDT5-1 TaxID=3406418 RepID=UPI003FD3AE48
MPSRPPDGDVLVSPLYLAGSTHTGDPALQPLLDCGFGLTGDEYGNVYVNSPDQRFRLGYMPEGPDDPLWKITAQRTPFAEPEWMATFDSPTPTELVSAFTSTLAAHYQHDPNTDLFGPSSPAQEAWLPLKNAGWRHSSARPTTFFTAPDELAGLTHSGRFLPRQDELRGERQRWLLWGGEDGYLERWYATFTSGVPTALIAATATRLADPNPVLRYEREVPSRNRCAAHMRPTPPPTPTPLDVRRVAAARARSLSVHQAAAHQVEPVTSSATLPTLQHGWRSAATRI